MISTDYTLVYFYIEILQLLNSCISVGLFLKDGKQHKSNGDIILLNLEFEPVTV